MAICYLDWILRYSFPVFRQNRVRFCLSNGLLWIFAILEKGENGKRAYYESTPRYIDKKVGQTQFENSHRGIQEIVELVLQWVSTNYITEIRATAQAVYFSSSCLTICLTCTGYTNELYYTTM